MAATAALSITEPVSAGVGGDCFCLYWDANIKCVHGPKGGYVPEIKPGRSYPLLDTSAIERRILL